DGGGGLPRPSVARRRRLVEPGDAPRRAIVGLPPGDCQPLDRLVSQPIAVRLDQPVGPGARPGQALDRLISDGLPERRERVERGIGTAGVDWLGRPRGKQSR
ncbi:MAG: hypothetical protein ACREOS_02380, partial [Candidatus Dormibacteraceae bacterium]